MKIMRNAVVALLLVLSSATTLSQDYNHYAFRGMRTCSDEQIVAFRAILVEAAATQAVGNTPDRFADAVKELARADITDRLERESVERPRPSRGVHQWDWGEAPYEILHAVTYPSDDVYDAVMLAFWHKPLLCRHALETIQRVSEAYQRRLLFQLISLQDKTLHGSELIATVDSIAGNPFDRLQQLVYFFLDSS